jgi:aspartokinase
MSVARKEELMQSKVCPSQDEVFSTGEQWKVALLERGWRSYGINLEWIVRSKPAL